jgi:hypothetical protein
VTSAVEQRELDAERMDLEDDSVDGVLCRFGYVQSAEEALQVTEELVRAAERTCAVLSENLPPIRQTTSYSLGRPLFDEVHAKLSLVEPRLLKAA